MSSESRKPFSTAGMYSRGMRPPITFVFEFEVLFGLLGQRLELADDVGVLARTAGLLLVLEVVFGGLGGRLRGS